MHKNKAARRKWQREYMRKIRKDPHYHALERSRVRRNMKKQRARIRVFIAEAKKSGCQLCPEKEPCCLSFHHRNPKTKKFSIAYAVARGYSLTKVAGEMKKCVCICENCHRKVHAKKLKLPRRVELVTPAVSHAA